MNARLINTNPESLHAQTETCSQVLQVMLSASTRLSELQFGALRSTLQLARDQVQSLDDSPELADWVTSCSNTFECALKEATTVFRESSRLTAESRQALTGLMDASWVQGQSLFRDLMEAQMTQLNTLGSALVTGAVKR